MNAIEFKIGDEVETTEGARRIGLPKGCKGTISNIITPLTFDFLPPIVIVHLHNGVGMVLLQEEASIFLQKTAPDEEPQRNMVPLYPLALALAGIFYGVSSVREAIDTLPEIAALPNVEAQVKAFVDRFTGCFDEGERDIDAELASDAILGHLGVMKEFGDGKVALPILPFAMHVYHSWVENELGMRIFHQLIMENQR